MENEALEPGTTLRNGKYKIIRKLNQGGFGITYLAFNGEKNIVLKEFFIKKREKSQMYSLRSKNHKTLECIGNKELFEKYRGKFNREVRHLRKIDDPRIPKILDFFDENMTSYYSMDFIEGEDLKDYVPINGLIEKEAVKLIHKIAETVNVLHKDEEPMLHLDISPGNIRIKPNDEIVLIDFGLSKAFDKNGNPESVVSTVNATTSGYAPTEQSKYDGGKFQPTLDTYALGAVFFKLLSGENPTDADKLSTSKKDLESMFAKLKYAGVSNKVYNVVRKAMTPYVDDRFQTVDEFLAALPEEKVLEAESEVSGGDNTQSETDTLSPKSFAEQLNDQGKEFYKNGNYQRAFELFKQSADKDFPNAKYNLGVCYEKGNGVEQHFGLAAMWYEDAAKSNFHGAKEKYQKITNEHPETAVYEKSTPISFLLSLFYWLGVIPTITGINKCEGEIGSILTAFVINYLLVSICFKQYALKRGLQLICGVGFCAVSAFYLITSDFSSWLIFVFVMGLIEAAKGIMYFTYLSKRKKLYNF
jgi:serine/threonine protein kinase